MSDEELCDYVGVFAVLKRNELEYEERHSGELERQRAEGKELLGYVMAIRNRVRAEDGFCPILTFAAENSVSENGAPEELSMRPVR